MCMRSGIRRAPWQRLLRWSVRRVVGRLRRRLRRSDGRPVRRLVRRVCRWRCRSLRLSRSGCPGHGPDGTASPGGDRERLSSRRFVEVIRHDLQDCRALGASSIARSRSEATALVRSYKSRKLCTTGSREALAMPPRYSTGDRSARTSRRTALRCPRPRGSSEPPAVERARGRIGSLLRMRRRERGAAAEERAEDPVRGHSRFRGPLRAPASRGQRQ